MLQPEKTMKPVHNLYWAPALPGPSADLVLVNGIPASGTHMGLCGQTSITPAIETTDLDTENQMAAIRTDVSSSSAEVSIVLYEMSATWLRIAQNATGNARKIIFGTKSMLDMNSIAVVYETFAGSKLFGYYLFYNVQLSSPSAHALAKGEYSQLEITFTAKPHSLYPDGDLYEHVVPEGFE